MATEIPIRCEHEDTADPRTLKPHPRNPNRHPAEQREAFEDVLRYQGWRKPIVVSTRSGCITRGHGLREAALAMGLIRVPIDRQEYGSDAEELADVLADNRLASMAVMDPVKLGKALGALAGDEEALRATAVPSARLGTAPTAGELLADVPEELRTGGSAAGDEKWIYAEWKDDPEAYEEARRLLGDLMRGPHEVDGPGLLSRLRRAEGGA
jgi:hypothetical protein